MAVMYLRDHHRTAQREPELVLFERLPLRPRGIGEEIVGIELLIADELPNGAVDLVRASLRRSAHNGSRRAAKLRAVVVGLDLELRHRVHRGNVVDAADARSEEHTSELQSLRHLVCRLLLEKKK